MQLPERESAIDLSVIVPTYGRSEVLAALLERIAGQTLAPERFEVIAADDGSPEPVQVDASRYRFSLTLLRQANAGPGAARNLALAHCRAPLVLILNDDAVPAPDLLAGHIAAHAAAASPCAVLGTFRFAPEVLASPFVRLLEHSDLLFDFPRLRHGQPHPWQFFWTCNISLPREAILSAGGFDAERFREPIVEDVELGYRLAKRGLPLFYREDLVCHHRHQLTPSGYLRRMVRLGVNLARMYDKHRDPTVLWFQGIAYWDYLQLSQLRYEAGRAALEEVAGLLERVETTFRGQELPAQTAETLTRTVRNVGITATLRGVVIEATGHDPEVTLSQPQPTGKLTSIVIVSYNGLAATQRCLEALRIAHDPAHPTEIVVVDNGSTDGSVEYLAAQPDVKLIAAGDNLGAPRARNVALPHTRGEWVVFMDNDAVVTRGWLARLLWHAHVDPLVGCVCPLSDRTNHGNQIAYEGDDSLAAITRFASQRAASYRRRARYALLFSSFCVLVRRAVVERIGGFDERFSPWGFEDDDFSLRAHLSGFRSRVALDVFVRHEAYAGPKLERHERLLTQNWQRFAQKWGEKSERPYGDYTLLHEVLARRWEPATLSIPVAGMGG